MGGSLDRGGVLAVTACEVMHAVPLTSLGLGLRRLLPGCGRREEVMAAAAYGGSCTVGAGVLPAAPARPSCVPATLASTEHRALI